MRKAHQTAVETANGTGHRKCARQKEQLRNCIHVILHRFSFVCLFILFLGLGVLFVLQDNVSISSGIGNIHSSCSLPEFSELMRRQEMVFQATPAL